MRRAAFGLVLAWLTVTGCTPIGDDAAGLDDGPPETADAFVELPPAPALTAPAAGAGAAGGVPLGAWRWGAPCRVAAREVVGVRFPRVARTFTIDVADAATGDGLVMSFDDVTEVSGTLGDEEVADALYRNLAVLPTMSLDADGRFVAFTRLEADLASLARRAGVGAADGVALILARQRVVTDTILDRTVLGWYGHWLDHDRLPMNPERFTSERDRPGPAGTWRWSTETFAAPVRGGRGEPPREGVVWLTHTERAVDADSGRVDASAIVDPTDRRPSYVVLGIDGFTSGGLATFASQDRRIVTFDWENAEGCR